MLNCAFISDFVIGFILNYTNYYLSFMLITIFNRLNIVIVCYICF